MIQTDTASAGINEAIAALYEEVRSLRAELAELRDTVATRLVVRPAVLRDLGSVRYRLSSPVEVITEEYDDGVTARFAEIESVGHGTTEPEALVMLKQDIVALYEELRDSPDAELGRLPQAWRCILGKLIVENASAQLQPTRSEARAR